MTLISRVLGFVRDMVLAGILGAGVSADAFFVAFRIPNLLRRFFAEGAFSQAFVPVLSDYKNRQGPAETRAFIDRAAGALAAVLGVITLAGILAAPLLVLLFAPGFLEIESKYQLTVALLRVTFPYILFISLAAFAAAILQSYGRFAVPAFTPTFLNLSMIVAALWMTGYFEEPVMALAWGVFAGGIFQLLFQLPFVARLGFFPIPRIKTDDPGVRRMLALMGPSIFGVSVVQINLLIDTLMASYLATGSVSWLYYSDRLVEFPLGVFGIALATVILPQLSDHHSSGSAETFSRTLDWALRCVLAVGAPAAVGLAVLAGPMMCTLFQYGEFGTHDVAMAAQSLTAYALGLLGFILVKILAPAYFARHDTKTPVKIGVVAMLVHLGLNLALIVPLAHAGLALATALAAYVNAVLLYRGLRRQGAYTPVPGWGRFLTRVFGATAIMAAFLIAASADLAQWNAWGIADRALRLAGLVGGGALLYGLGLWALGLRSQHMTVSRSPV
jgi:putative peptidoglycan lipid II flippase